MVNNNREAFEAACELLPEGITWGEPITPSIAQSIAQAALAQVNEVKQSQAQQPTDLSKQLREYAADSGYSHNDYADTMLSAASEIERYAARLAASQGQQTESQWISIEERLPDGDHFVDVFVRSRNNLAYGTRFTEFLFINGMFDVLSLPSTCYVSHWKYIPPAPEGEKPASKDVCPKCSKPWEDHEFAVPAPYCP